MGDRVSDFRDVTEVWEKSGADLTVAVAGNNQATFCRTTRGGYCISIV